jgi:DTW domain-containing protein YfiP
MKIYLLTHERELQKRSNTGRMVKRVLGDLIEIIPWKRKEPDANLVELLSSGHAVMLFPDEQTEQSASLGDVNSFVIIDSTWQEARKIYNRSAYLKDAKKASLKVMQPSTYLLRRNQVPGGLSTAECVVELLKLKHEPALAIQVQKAFDQMNTK